MKRKTIYHFEDSILIGIGNTYFRIKKFWKKSFWKEI